MIMRMVTSICELNYSRSYLDSLNSMINLLCSAQVTRRIHKFTPIHAFIRFPEFAECTELLFHLGRTPLHDRG